MNPSQTHQKIESTEDVIHANWEVVDDSHFSDGLHHHNTSSTTLSLLSLGKIFFLFLLGLVAIMLVLFSPCTKK